MAVFRRLSKLLICAHCGAVIATAAYRPLLSRGLDITSLEGDQLMPVTGSLQLRLAQQDLASAEPAERHQAQWRVEFINRNLWEAIYDLPCPRGHRTLATAPQIARAMRTAKGGMVTLIETSH